MNQSNDNKNNLRQNKTKLLSEKLDLELNKVKNFQDNNLNLNKIHKSLKNEVNDSTSTMAPFQLLEQKLKRLQQKLEKVKEVDGRRNYAKKDQSSDHDHHHHESKKKLHKNQLSINDSNQLDDSSQIPLTNRKSSIKKPVIYQESLNDDYTKIKQKSSRKPSLQNHSQPSNKKSSPQTHKSPPLRRQKQQKQFQQKENVRVREDERNEIDHESSQKKGQKKKKVSISHQKDQNAADKDTQNYDSKKNTKLNTPIKNHQTIQSTKKNKGKSQSKRKTSNIKEVGSIGKNSIKKARNSNLYHNQNGHFAISDSQYETGYKMQPKNLLRTASPHKNESDLQKKLRKKSLTSSSNPGKRRSSSSTKNLQSSRKSPNPSHFPTYPYPYPTLLSASRQPLIPLRQKLHLQQQLKHQSKENLKLKQKVNQLHKYEQEFYKMKEIFERFGKGDNAKKSGKEEKGKGGVLVKKNGGNIHGYGGSGGGNGKK